MNRFFAIALAAAVCAVAFACAPKAPAPLATNHDWSEPRDPAPAPAAAWDAVSEPAASWGSVDVRYPLSEPFAGEIATGHTITGWRGEKVHAQLVVWTPDEIRDLTCTVGDFKRQHSKTVSVIADAGRARFVKYVLSDSAVNPTAICAKPEGEPVLMPDLLDEAPVMIAAARTTRPVWITVEIPRAADPGVYSADVHLSGKGFSQTLTLDLDVIDRVLPPASEWAYHLDLWQHPSAVARIEGVPVWSDEHFEALRTVMKPLADAGQKVITATLNKDPWNNQCFDPYADMIIWTKNPDGGWSYDFSAFDRWVQFMLDLGVTRMINCYSMLPWNNMLHYKDGATGEFVDVKADPGSPEFDMMWEPFLPAFSAHLKEKGWLEITNIAIDERPREQMEAMTKLLSRVAPELGISLADNHELFKQYPYIKDMCAVISGPLDRADIHDRRAQGLNTTFYVCCGPDFPNTFTFCDPAEAVYLGWYAASMDYDGMLRWTYNSWVEDPIRDMRFRSWSSGDTALVYPEGRSSIRFERLVEGIQDFEKMRILKAEAGKAALIEPLLKFGSYKRYDEWNDDLNAAKKALNEMSR